MITSKAIQEILKANNWAVLSDKVSYYKAEKQLVQAYKVVIAGSN